MLQKVVMSLAYYTIIYKNIMSEIAFETLFLQSTEQRQQNLQPLSSEKIWHKFFLEIPSQIYVPLRMLGGITLKMFSNGQQNHSHLFKILKSVFHIKRIFH